MRLGLLPRLNSRVCARFCIKNGGIDILPAVKGEDSRPPLGYCGLRRGLFLRCECTSFLVKQERRWLCQPAVTPISPIRGETRRYFLSDILSTVHVCIRYCPAVIADVQPTFNTVRLALSSTTRTRLRCNPFGHLLNCDVLHLCFVGEHRGEAVERPRVQI